MFAAWARGATILLARILLGTTLLFLTTARVTAQQEARDNRSKRFESGSCGPVDPNYIRIANESGGQPFFLQPSEAAKAFHLLRDSTESNRNTLLWATAALNGRSQEFTVPVDSTVKKLTLSLSADSKGSAMTLIHPSGTEVATGDSGTETTELNCGRIVTVNAPEPGHWRVQITGWGTIWVQAQAKSQIFFVSVEFVQPGGRPGHEGLFRIPGQPLAGPPATLEADLSGPVKTAAFKLVSKSGETIKLLTMTAVDSGPDERRFVGTFELPTQPFRVAVMGLDADGQSYQRFFHTLFHAETVEVVLADRVDSLSPGKTTSIRFTVRNVGAPATFSVVVADTKGFVSKVDPQEFSLDTGASGTITVEMTVPAATPLGTGVDLTITATSTTGPATTNGTSHHFSVFAGENLH